MSLSVKYAISAAITSGLVALGILWGVSTRQNGGSGSLLAGDVFMFVVLFLFVLALLGTIVFDVITIIRSYFLYGRDLGIELHERDYGIKLYGEGCDRPAPRTHKLFLYGIAVPLFVYVVAEMARHIALVAARGALQ